MTPTRIFTATAAAAVMALCAFVMPLVIAPWHLSFGGSHRTRIILHHMGAILPDTAAAVCGLILLFAARGTLSIKSIGWGVAAGAILVLLFEMAAKSSRHFSSSGVDPFDASDFSQLDAATAIGPVLLALCGAFAMRVAVRGNAAFQRREPKRIRGRRALHGDADWMSLTRASKLFGEGGGIVIGECYRVDHDSAASIAFRSDNETTWGAGGRSKLLCFDTSFGSTHGIAFAGSGGFKTTSVTIPTALKWNGTLIVLDPSNEVAPMVEEHRKRYGRDVFVLNPKDPTVGFNALDWIGRHGTSKEEDIAAIASWIMSESARASGHRDDFFRASALQLLTAVIADVCLSGHTDERNQNLRTVRANLSEPEPKLRARLERIHETSQSEFVKENVATFVNMTPETFSGVYANAIKETHWLSYPNYAALVSGSTFATDDLANGKTDIFIALDLKTLEMHAGLARVMIGTFLNAIYGRDGAMPGRALFLLDEVARLGFMRILETARDAGRKYGISLILLYQSIGQMRESFGGRDAASKWFESASWISFSAINDPETADYISRRCGMTTVEIDKMSRSFQAKGTSRTRSTQLASRPLILPHEVLQMRADEQIVFTSGNPPLRCGRALWFRRSEMRACLNQSRFGQAREHQNIR